MSPRAMVMVAVAALLLAVLLVMLALPRQEVSPAAGHREEPATPTGTQPPPPAPPRFGEVCARHQTRTCDGGDAWFVDSCGRREERAERCDDSYCERGQCVQPSPGPACAGLSEGGRCDGELLRWCEHGRARAVDCAALGRRCGRSAIGEPNCLQPAPCKEDECSGKRALACVDQQYHALRCGSGSTCELDDHHHARCVRRVDKAWVERAPCHGCACPSPGPEEEVPPIPVTAFLVTDDSGASAESEERARLEVEMLSYWFSYTRPTGLHFFLREVKKISRPAWLSADESSIQRAAFDAELHPADQPFFVPVVFVRDLKVGVKTTPGVGLLPGGVCADLSPRPDELPDDGVIFIGRLRNLTTLAHEMGHYLGLCHTHQGDPLPPRVTLREDGAPLECAVCGQNGDGVCDTAVDPGLDGCSLDEQHCTVTCAGGAAPDPANLMSYFVPCRRIFSDEQTAWMRLYARLRLRSRSH